jgi:hypothetical protein
MTKETASAIRKEGLMLKEATITLRDPPLELLEKMLKAVSAPRTKEAITEAKLICRVIAEHIELEPPRTTTLWQGERKWK